MSDDTILKLRRIQVGLGDLPDESAEISGGLTNGQLLSRLRGMTPESAELDDIAEDMEEDFDSAEMDI